MVFKSLSEGQSFSDKYKLIIVDEYQDFNKLEVAMIDLLATKSHVMVVGDDDQAIYDFKNAKRLGGRKNVNQRRQYYYDCGRAERYVRQTYVNDGRAHPRIF